MSTRECFAGSDCSGCCAQVRNVDDHDPRSPLARKTFNEPAGAAARGIVGEAGSCEEAISLCSSAASRI